MCLHVYTASQFVCDRDVDRKKRSSLGRHQPIAILTNLVSGWL